MQSDQICAPLPTSEVKCAHFHGSAIVKPIPSYQVYRGTVFELVDKAVDFVMSKIAASVGTRAEGPTAPVKYELPPTLTLASLRRPHPSVPHNPLLAGPMFLAGYIEKAGTGTLDMAAHCRKAGLRPPEFQQESGVFKQIFRRKGTQELSAAGAGGGLH